MASNPPGACCTIKHIHEGQPQGTHLEIAGRDTYEIGKENGNDKILVILTDIYGYKFQNTLLLADEFSRFGFHVLVPDILNQDPFEGPMDQLPEWLKSHTPEITSPIVKGFLSRVKTELKPNKIYGIGYCFGAKYLTQGIGADAAFDAGAIAHPSFVSEEDVHAVTKPLLISAAQVDPIFTVEQRHKTEKILTENNATFQINLFSGVSHGFACRADLDDESAKYAKERTFTDQISWFKRF